MGKFYQSSFSQFFLELELLWGVKKAKPLGNFFSAAAEAVLKVAHMVMQVAPYGVLSLVAWVAGTMGLAALQNLLVLTIILYFGVCFIWYLCMVV